jgi:mannitol PTS system EIICBA or EIICB component
MAQATATGSESGGASLRVRVQKFGSFLSGMVMPNIGAFIAWGLITALFIDVGWTPNATLAKLVDPMIIYLLPLLIGFTGGRLVYDFRGGVVGAIATMGVIVGTDVPMFLGALIMGPLGGYAIMKFDGLLEGKIRPGFEMLVNNFSAGIIGGALAILGLIGASPIVTAISNALGAAVDVIVGAGLLPLVSIFVEPAKILFLNNAINHGILTPLGTEQAQEAGKSILFMVETNPGPGLGILLAYMLFGRGATRSSAYGASVIHFFGGIHEIYFPYVLMKPVLVLAAIAGGASGLLTATIFGAGLVAPPAPGSIFAYFAMLPREGWLGVLLAVVAASAVSFVVASVILRVSPVKDTDDSEDTLSQASAQMQSMKGKPSAVAQTSNGSSTATAERTNGHSDTAEQTDGESFDYANVSKVIFACDAGMGSSAMGASLLRNKAKKAGLEDLEVKNTAISQIPSDADVVITHKDLTDRARNKLPGAHHVSVDNFLGSPKYDELIEEISASRV